MSWSHNPLRSCVCCCLTKAPSYCPQANRNSQLGKLSVGELGEPTSDAWSNDSAAVYWQLLHILHILYSDGQAGSKKGVAIYPFKELGRWLGGRLPTAYSVRFKHTTFLISTRGVARFKYTQNKQTNKKAKINKNKGAETWGREKFR